MEATDLNYISVIAAGISCVAAITASIISWKAGRYQKTIEGNRLLLLKNQDAINHLQKVIGTFAQIKATAETEWSAERTEKLKTLSDEVKYQSSIISSLNQVVGEKLYNWKVSKNGHNESVPYIVSHILANNGAIIGDKYDRFFRSKSIELELIQDYLFNSMLKA